MTGLEAGLGLMTVAGTVIGGYMGLKLNPLEKADEAHEKALENLRRETDKRLSGLHDDMRAEHKEFEQRLVEIEKSYLSRADLTAAIKEMREHMDRGVDRVEAVVRALGTKVDILAEKVARSEASE